MEGFSVHAPHLMNTAVIPPPIEDTMVLTAALKKNSKEKVNCLSMPSKIKILYILR
jgi:hypothetical protein